MVMMMMTSPATKPSAMRTSFDDFGGHDDHEHDDDDDDVDGEDDIEVLE